MKPTVRIEDWEYDGRSLRGYVKDHPRLGSPEHHCRTSEVLLIDEIERIAETRNTIYRLGQKKDV